MRVELYPGLKKRTGLYSFYVGGFRPVVYVDPVTRMIEGGSANVSHELCHAKQRHDIIAVLFLVFTLGLLYPWWRRRAEILADRFAFRCHGYREFWDFVYLYPLPKTRWGRWLYGATPADRIQRAMR
jgi:hypothetical protein